MTSDDVTKGVRRYTLVAAENCYGAQLFEATGRATELPISNAYLGA